MYCSCGAHLDLSKERCGSCSMRVPQEARDTSKTRASGKKNDRWHKTYCTPPSSASSSRHATPTGPASQTTAQPSTTSSGPSSVLLANKSNKSLPALPALSRTTSSASTTSAILRPLLPSHTGSSIGSIRVFGSIFDAPAASLHCVGCKTAFGRVGGRGNEVIYPAEGYPADGPDARFHCLTCYSAQSSKGDCQRCCRPVLGIKGDPMITNKGRVWHERCFVCETCSRKATVCSLDDRPICEPCFFGESTATPPARAQPHPTMGPPSTSSRPKSNLGGLATKPVFSASDPSSRPRSSFVPPITSSKDTTPTQSHVRQGPSVSDLAARFVYAPATNPDLSPRNPLQSPSSRKLEIRDQPGPSALRSSSFARESKIPSTSTRPLTMFDWPLARTNSDLSTFSSSEGGDSEGTSAGTLSDVWGSKDSGLDQVAGGSGDEKKRIGAAERTELELEDLMMEVQRACRVEEEEPSPKPATRTTDVEDLSATIRSKPSLPSQASRRPTSRIPSASKIPSPIAATRPCTLPAPSSSTASTPTPAPSTTMGPPTLPLTSRANLTHSHSHSNHKPYPSSSSPASNLYASRPSTRPLPKFGGMTVCSGCTRSVAPMEMGVIAGPNGSRWHKRCLTCGGGQERGPQVLRVREQERERGKGLVVGCGRQLDVDGKVDGEGGVWCRVCVDTSRRSLRPLSVACTGDALSLSTSRLPTSTSAHTRTKSLYLPSSLSSSIMGPPTSTSSINPKINNILGASTSARTNAPAPSPASTTASLAKSTTSAIARTRPAPITTTTTTHATSSSRLRDPSLSLSRAQTQLARPRSILLSPGPVLPTSASVSVNRNLTGSAPGSEEKPASSISMGFVSRPASALSHSSSVSSASSRFSGARVTLKGFRDESWGGTGTAGSLNAAKTTAAEKDKPNEREVGGKLDEKKEKEVMVKRGGSILERAGVRRAGGWR